MDTELLTPDDGNCNAQALTISGSVWPTGVGRLCGINPDQHFYIHFNDGKSNFQHIDFDIVTSHSNKPYKFGKYIWLIESCT